MVWTDRRTGKRHRIATYRHLAEQSSDGTCRRETIPEKRGKIQPRETLLRVEMPDGRVMRYHPECVPEGLCD